MPIIPECHPDRPYHAKGFCKSCYHSEYGKGYTRKRTPGQYQAHKNYNTRWNKKNAAKRAKKYLNKDRSRKMGIAVEELEKVFEDQDGLCRLGCGRFAKCADHDHVTNRFRGFLCTQCNLGLGYFQDSPDLLQRAIAYLVEAKYGLPNSQSTTSR